MNLIEWFANLDFVHWLGLFLASGLGVATAYFRKYYWREMPSLDNIETLPPEPYKPASVPPVMAPTAPKQPPETSLKWDTITSIKHSIRVIADEEGLTFQQKDMLCEICSCESGFNLKARLQNNPKSIDRGLFQWNSYWHPQITDEIAYNPEMATRLACRAIKQGKARTYWSASEHCWNKNGRFNSLLGG